MTIVLSGSMALLGLSILLLIFIYGRKAAHKGQPEQRIFNLLLLTVAIILVCGFVRWLPMEQVSLPGKAIPAVESIYLLTMTLTGSLWLVYCDMRVLRNGQLHHQQWRYLIPLALGVMLLILHLVSGYFYYIDVSSGYGDSPLYPFLVALFLAVVVWSALLVIIGSRHNNLIQRRENLSMLYCLLPVIAGLALRLVAGDINFVPISLVLALLIAFIQQQESLIMRDSLTKLNNLRALDAYLEQRLANPPVEQQVFLVMLDADHFKEINDTFGHSRGNEALVKIAAVLSAVCRKTDFIARLGGDEFIIVGQCIGVQEVLALCQEIDQAIAKENTQGDNHYTLSLSWGYVIYDKKIHQNSDQLIHDADQAMYANKEMLYCQQQK